MKTSDTTFAAHLIERGYILAAVDAELPRHGFFFDISDEDWHREHNWFIRNGIGNKRRIAAALGAAMMRKPMNPQTLRKWPCLAVAIAPEDAT